MSDDHKNISTGSKRPEYIEGVGWRFPVEHRMTRWPLWKDSHKPGTYMVTLNVNGGQRVLGSLAGSTAEMYRWMKAHPDVVQAASADALYYRHAMLGKRAMPFVLKPISAVVETTADKDGTRTASVKAAINPGVIAAMVASPCGGPSSCGLCGGVSTPSGVGVSTPAGVCGPSSCGSCGGVSTPSGVGGPSSCGLCGGVSTPAGVGGPTPAGVGGPSSCGLCGGVSTPAGVGVSTPAGVGVSTAVVVSSRPRTHFPVEALRLPGAPHVVLSALGERVKECWERMAEVEPGIELVCLAIMPNHIHAIIAVRRELNRAIGAVIRSFMGVTSHALHKMIGEGTIRWNADAATITRKASAEKPSLWSPGFCVGVCQSEEKLHTRIGYVLENPFFGVLEGEQQRFMERTMWLTIAGRAYSGYGNMLLLKEPDRIQVFCHRRHPATGEPYHQTQDFREEREAVLNAAREGVVIVTPGISPGESEIMWAVLRSGGSVINLQKDEIPLSDKWHPSKERRIYCSQGRMLVLSVRDLPQQTFRDRYGNVIPSDSSYVRFHLLNLVAEELCSDGIEHQCVVRYK